MNRLFESVFEHPVMMRVVALVVALILWFGNAAASNPIIDRSVGHVPVVVVGGAPNLEVRVTPRFVTVELATTVRVWKEVRHFPFQGRVSAAGLGPGDVRRPITVVLPGATLLTRVVPAQVQVHVSGGVRRLGG
jgi:hypothetical protein